MLSLQVFQNLKLFLGKRFITMFACHVIQVVQQAPQLLAIVINGQIDYQKAKIRYMRMLLMVLV